MVPFGEFPHLHPHSCPDLGPSPRTRASTVLSNMGPKVLYRRWTSGRTSSTVESPRLWETGPRSGCRRTRVDRLDGVSGRDPTPGGKHSPTRGSRSLRKDDSRTESRGSDPPTSTTDGRQIGSRGPSSLRSPIPTGSQSVRSRPQSVWTDV